MCQAATTHLGLETFGQIGNNDNFVKFARHCGERQIAAEKSYTRYAHCGAVVPLMFTLYYPAVLCCLQDQFDTKRRGHLGK